MVRSVTRAAACVLVIAVALGLSTIRAQDESPRDLLRVLDFGASVFTEDAWHVTVLSDQTGGAQAQWGYADAEARYTRFRALVQQFTGDPVFSPEIHGTIQQINVTEIVQCEADGVRLIEDRGTFANGDDAPVIVRNWLFDLGGMEFRLVSLLHVVDPDAADMLAAVSRRIAPALPDCDGGASVLPDPVAAPAPLLTFGDPLELLLVQGDSVFTPRDWQVVEGGTTPWAEGRQDQMSITWQTRERVEGSGPAAAAFVRMFPAFDVDWIAAWEARTLSRVSLFDTPESIATRCEMDDLTLIETRSLYELGDSDFSYTVRYWVTPLEDGTTRLVAVGVHNDALVDLDELSAQLFPDLPRCRRVANNRPSEPDRIRDYAEGRGLAAPEWEEFFFTQAFYTTVAWRSSSANAVIALSLLPGDLTVDQAWLDGLMGNYSPYTQIATCGDGLRLWELDGINQGSDYRTHYWIEPQNDGRAVGVHLVVSAQEPEYLEAWSTRLFPDLPSCEE